MARTALAWLNLAVGAAVAAGALAFGATLAASDPRPVLRREAALVVGAAVAALGLLQAVATLLLLAHRRAGYVLQRVAGALLALPLLAALWRSPAWAITPVALLLLAPAALLALPHFPSVRPAARARPPG